MRFARYCLNGRTGLLMLEGTRAHGICTDEEGYPGDLESVVWTGGDALQRAGEALRKGREIDVGSVTFLPVLGLTGKIICVGVNYLEHARETNYQVPAHPTIFARYPSSLVGHKAALIRPKVSVEFDYEGELVAVIGKSGRHIAKTSALDHVCGYTIFNDATVRDWQFETTQWTIGKNFDGTGAVGPFFVTADELPPGAKGLKIETRLNGKIVQQSNTGELISDVATCIEYLSQAFALNPGDILLTGTPPGVGWGRKPQLWMKAGDTCEIEVEGVGTLVNPIADET
jgi:acylpyruvate hydrolase